MFSDPIPPPHDRVLALGPAMARKVLVLAGMAAQQLLVRGSEVKKGPVTSRHLQITTST